MGIQIDLIIPPVIVGLLVVVVFQLNAFIMETSIDNQLNNDMQTFAELTSSLIQEEVRSAGDIERPTGVLNADSVLVFVNVAQDSVRIQRSGKNLAVIHYNSSISLADTVIYPSSLSSLEFEMVRKPDTALSAYFLNTKVVTESDTEQHASIDGNSEEVRGFSENEIYLRNIHAKVEAGGSP
ncbi:MAG: hypothetical protein RI575_17140 [Balneolaceae bacterium]|nr:hypothetical protein [Balneolaceae bacterium]MDR9410660.1 hypothetical protein [Balneolaceae bacterium]